MTQNHFFALFFLVFGILILIKPSLLITPDNDSPNRRFYTKMAAWIFLGCGILILAILFSGMK